MNIAYKPYSLCPEKPMYMPEGYPWCVTYLSENQIPDKDYIVVTEQEYNDLLNTFDLTEYNTYIIQKAIEDRIKYYQSVAPDIITEIYAYNTLHGMTKEQSDALFDEMSDVLFRIKEGAFPTAIYRLQSKEPNAVLTLKMINQWIALIEREMV